MSLLTRTRTAGLKTGAGLGGGFGVGVRTRSKSVRDGLGSLKLSGDTGRESGETGVRRIC